MKKYTKEEVLRQYEESGKKENGIFGFNAKTTLEVWEKQGCLRIYTEKEK